MKKLTLSFLTALLMLAFLPSHVTATTSTVPDKVTVSTDKPAVTPEVQALILRLDVIKAMDVSKMSSVEKRELRKELRSIKATLYQMDGSIIYISAGGLIVILLLILILF